MHGNFSFESTQSRGNRIQMTLGDIGWGEMPEDGLLLKEYEAPTIKKDDTPPPQKPYIKNTLRQFWYEPSEEEKSEPQPQINPMEIERPYHGEETAETEDVNSREESRKATPIQNEPKGKQIQPQPSQFQTERKIRMLKKQEEGGFAAVITQGTQYTQSDDRYMKKLVHALGDSKLIRGKTKHSQKFPKPSSSTLFEKKMKQAEMMSQMTHGMDDINEDIEDLEEVQEHGVYVSNIGHKKLKLEVDVETMDRQAIKTISKDGKDSLQEKDNGRDKSLQDSLEKAIRRASNQAPIRWLVKVISFKTTKGINTVEFVCISPNSEGNEPSYAIINAGKQYYAQHILPDKKYYFINPRTLVPQKVNNKKVYYVDKIEEAVN